MDSLFFYLKNGRKDLMDEERYVTIDLRLLFLSIYIDQSKSTDH